VPFVRTTDIVNWEIKIDPIKCVPVDIYNQYRKKQDIRENDILFVNDGTFLIGRSSMVTNLDTKIIIQSHIRRIRVTDTTRFDPYLLFYLLNTRIVKKQIESKTFIQATISTLGNRLSEVVLPVPRSEEKKQKWTSEMKKIIQAKTELRRMSLKLIEL
jgi:type I restriction enzyme M protein